MVKYQYIKDFEQLSVGLFVHFGLYSVLGMGEWYLRYSRMDPARYEALTERFRVKKSWAQELVTAAKAAGAKYITLTTRHHDGFSLYDTKGLSDYDAPHSAAKRDLVREFVEACREGGVVPFFYHTLLDWRHPDYRQNFDKYLDYLRESVRLLLTEYGKIGGFWFDGKWDKPDADWREDELYAMIRSYQPEAMIINNTGLSALGKVGHHEIDSVTFERGKPRFVDRSDKYRSGEMCQGLNDHWGYAREDLNYLSVKELIGDLIECRRFGCNFLVNTGLLGNGGVNPIDYGLLSGLGKWILRNKNFIYGVKPCDIVAENAIIFQGNGAYYAVIPDVPMEADPHVTPNGEHKRVKISAELLGAIWMESGKLIHVEDNSFAVEPFPYGESLCVRVARLLLNLPEEG